MSNINTEFKNKVVEALFIYRQNFDYSDARFATQVGLSASILSRLKKGERDKVLSDVEWVRLAVMLGVDNNNDRLKVGRTDVFNQIEQDILFCKATSQSRIFADDPEIGKTRTAVHLSKTLPNCFYVNCDEARTRQLFIRTLAKTLGLSSGKYVDLKKQIKYYLNMIENPIVLLDDGGYLDFNVFLDLNELWNGTEGRCSWYMLGDETLSNKISIAIKNKKPGIWAFFSRYSSKCDKITPLDFDQKVLFHQKLATDILHANGISEERTRNIVKQAVSIDPETDRIACLRRLNALITLNP